MKRNNFITFVLVPLISIFLFSCSKDLSRDEAETLIKQKYNLPKIETVEIVKNYHISHFGDRGAFGMEMVTIVTSPNYSENKKMLDGLQSKGLITVNETKEYSNHIHYTWATVSLTAEGKKYLVKESRGQYEVKSAEIAFGQITGIQMNEQNKVAEAEYTLQRINITPFSHSSSNDIMNRHQSFYLYDDGWRIK